MKHILFPRHVWARLQSWLPLLSALYALLVHVTALVADALAAPPPPGAKIWFGPGFYVAISGLLLSPLVPLSAWLAALLCPRRASLGMADYTALVLSLLAIIAWGVFLYLTLWA
jgi:hypothetical protein